MAPLIQKPLPNHGNLVWQITTKPAVEPITTTEVKNWGKIETSAEDSIIENLITAIRQMAESWLGRALIEQTITSTLDFWPGIIVKLPRPPLISITSISTIDEEDNETTYSTDNYFARIDIEPGQAVIKNGSSPPINANRYYGGFKIIHVNGYGDEAADVPQDLKQGLIEWVLFALENRLVNREPPENAIPTLKKYQMLSLRI